MASTPPPPSPTSLRTPGAPLHGAGYDMYSPYPTRYSTRLARQRALKAKEPMTPSICPSSPRKTQAKSSPRKKIGGGDRILSPSDINFPDVSGSNSTTSGLNYATRDPASLSYDYDSVPLPNSHHSSSIHALPTPAKTPSKKKVSPDLSSTARALFPKGTMSKKKQGPFSLESFDESAPGQEEITIFTDSRDRVPMASTSEDNPFVTRAQDAAPRTTRTSQRARSTDAIRYNFRGKTIMKQIPSDDEDDGSDDDLGLFKSRPDLLSDPSILANVRTLSRSSIAPRVLWPSKDHKSIVIEEAHTDDELAEKVPDPFDSPLATPQSGDLTRAPGATRNLRSNARFEEGADVTPTSSPTGKRKRISPFDGWQRKKGKEASTPTTGSPTKRDITLPADGVYQRHAGPFHTV